MHAHFQNALPEVARRDRLDDFARGGVLEIPRIVRVFVAHRSLDFLHEGVREVDPVVQVQSLQVLVARGFAHFDEGNDVGVVRVEKRSVGAASGRALTVGEAGRVVDLEVRHHAHALFVGVADAHVNADAASGHGKAVHFAQRLDETVGAVGHVGEVARDGEAVFRAPEGKNRRRKGEPVARGVVVDALRVGVVRGELLGDEGEAFLRALFVGTHVAFAKPDEAELVKERVAGEIDFHGHGWGS